MGVKDIANKPDLKEVSEEFKKHVPEYVLLITYSDNNYMRIDNTHKTFKDILLEARQAVDDMVHAQRSRLFFFNPKQRTLSAEIQAMDETEYAMICFALKALRYPVTITRM